MSSIKPEFNENNLYTLSGNAIEMHKVMIRPYDDYIGKTIIFGKYNDVVSAWYTDVPVKESTKDSCIIRTSYGNSLELNGLSEFSSDDLIFAMHCEDGYIRLWFSCDPRNIINDYLKIGFELASPYVKLDGRPVQDNASYYAVRKESETFDIILPMHSNCWEKEYDKELQKCKCKFIISHTKVKNNTEISYDYTSKVEDFIHCIVAMDGYILIEAYDLPNDREYVRLSVTISNKI